MPIPGLTCERLLGSETRLVTLTGLGGSGKTRREAWTEGQQMPLAQALEYALAPARRTDVD